MQHQPRKRFGQHFLRDFTIIEKILATTCLQPGERFLEIGPGLGALSTALLPILGKLEAIELDRDVIPLLKEKCASLGELQVYAADALTVDFATIIPPGETRRIIGNLPYNISTPLLFHLLANIDYFSDMHFMLQKEVALRLAATPGNADYGRLSIMIQYDCEVEILFHVPPHAFNPPPKVDSSFIRLTKRQQRIPLLDKVFFSTLVKQAFNQRRKTLHNSLQTIIPKAIWPSLPVSGSLRAQDVSVTEYVHLCNCLVEQKK